MAVILKNCNKKESSVGKKMSGDQAARSLVPENTYQKMTNEV